MEQFNGQLSEWKGHDVALGNYARKLKKLVHTAKLKGCYNYHYDADRIIRIYESS